VITEVFSGIPVADYAAGRVWYERLTGRPPDMPVNDNECAWQLAGAGWMYVIGDAERAGNALLTVLVDDLDVHLAELADRGIEVGPVETIPGAVRSAWVTDPDGNRVQFGQPLR
jgi:catechol 2,3-dioxygenase-like lactoylglutathione lyase family enzyme